MGGFFGVARAGEQALLAESAVSVLTPAPDVLLIEAQTLLNKFDRYSDKLVVMQSHAACDSETQETLNHLVVVHGRRADDMRRLKKLGAQLSLHRGRVLQFYMDLSGDDPRGQGWWAPWRASTTLRNRVAHEGAQVLHADARASLGACAAYVTHLRQVRNSRGAGSPAAP